MPEVRCPLDQTHAAVQIGLHAAANGPQPVEGFPEPHPEGASRYVCSHCGPFVLSPSDVELLELPTENVSSSVIDLRNRLMMEGYKLKALLREHETQKLPIPWIQFHRGPYWPVVTTDNLAQIHIDDLFNRWPQSVEETLDRIMLTLGARTHEPGEPCRVGDLSQSGFEGFPLLFAKFNRDASFYVVELERRNWVRSLGEHGLLVLAQGWQHIDGLKRTRPSPRNPVFVAMWFGDDEKRETTAYMTDLYNSAIAPAIDRAGYRSDRVDLVPHSDFIMNKALGMIRVAPFVVADLTGNRNGVYFEAGFARGIGHAVAHTCHRNHFSEAHFDVKQIGTILWTDPAELAEKLYHWIAADRGFGPFKRQPILVGPG